MHQHITSWKLILVIWERHSILNSQFNLDEARTIQHVTRLEAQMKSPTVLLMKGEGDKWWKFNPFLSSFGSRYLASQKFNYS